MYNISNFDNVNDYLPMLNSVILTDILVMVLALSGLMFQSSVLFEWYKKFTLGAVITDVLIIVLGLILARYLYPKIFNTFELWKFILLAVSIQIVHDFLFYKLVLSIPRGKSSIVDVFFEYGKENGVKAIMADSFMMIVASLLFSYLGDKTTNTNIIVLIRSVYMVPYLVYSMK